MEGEGPSLLHDHLEGTLSRHCRDRDYSALPSHWPGDGRELSCSFLYPRAHITLQRVSTQIEPLDPNGSALECQSNRTLLVSRASATTGVVPFGRGIASLHCVKWSVMTRTTLLPLVSLRQRSHEVYRQHVPWMPHMQPLSMLTVACPTGLSRLAYFTRL